MIKDYDYIIDQININIDSNTIGILIMLLIFFAQVLWNICEKIKSKNKKGNVLAFFKQRQEESRLGLNLTVDIFDHLKNGKYVEVV